MASVAICPHCFLQLVVPHEIARDARVACPTCAKEFDLDQAVLRAIPEVAVIERASAPAELVSGTVAEDVATHDSLSSFGGVLPQQSATDFERSQKDTVRRADAEIAAWFQQAKTVPEVTSITEMEHDVEAKLHAADDTGDEMKRAEDARPVRPSPTTLADLLPPQSEQDYPLPGPSFDLPNVPLKPGNEATVEIESASDFGPMASTEFELDDVDFEVEPADEVASATGDAAAGPDSASEVPAPYVVPPVSKKRKNRSVLRTLVGTALGGVVGLPLGYYVLLHMLGPQGDFLQVTQFFPSAILPASFQATSTHVVENAAPSVLPADDAVDPIDADDSANVPAGYVEEVVPTEEPTTNNESVEEDRYGTEPPRIEEPTAAPLTDEVPTAALAPLPLSGPSYSADQLAIVLEDGTQAQVGLVTGDLGDAAVRRTKGLSYAKLCDLAHTLVFLDRTSQTNQSEVMKRRVEWLFAEALADERIRDEVSRVAAIWIDSPHRRHGGIFLAGTVGGGQIAGDVYEYQLSTNEGNTLTLLFEQPLDPLLESSGHPIGIVGTVVDSPAEQITGYTGTAPRAIWVASAIPLE